MKKAKKIILEKTKNKLPYRRIVIEMNFAIKVENHLSWFYKVLDKLLEKRRNIFINGFNVKYVNKAIIYNWALDSTEIGRDYFAAVKNYE